MRLTLLGTGCPAVHSRRFSPAQTVDDGETTLLIDCGSGVTQRLHAAGISGRDIDAVFLTHLHTDHVIDLYQLIISSWHQGRDRAQRIFGPPGTRAYVEGLMALWKPERDQRIEHERRPSTAAFEIEVTEIMASDPQQIGSLRISPFEVDHRPVRHAFGFNVEDGTRKLTLSGDTAPCAGLTEAAHGADALLHEVFVHREMPVVEGVRTAQTIENVAAYHTGSDRVGKIARDAGVGCLILTHFVPPDCDREALAEEVAADFAGPFIIGEDLLAFDLGTRRVIHADAVVSRGSVEISTP